MAPLSDDYLARFSAALVAEIKLEMTRQGIRSTRELGRKIGHASSYMSDRIDGGSSKTKKRVQINVQDLAEIADALKLEPSELMVRAKRVIDSARFDPRQEPPEESER